MKVLVTAESIRTLHRDGTMVLNIVPARTIVTPEARDLAHKLGVNIVDQSGRVEGEQTVASDNTVQQIKQAIEAKLPPGKHDCALLEQLVRKALSDLNHGGCDREVSNSGVVLVHGNSVKFGQFDGIPDKPIGLTDVIGAADKSSIAAGFMQWEQCSFPWTLTYDEIDVVLEGELHIRCDGKTYVGHPGDVFYIPKGCSIEFATPSKVRFVYVTYPADWAAVQD